MCFDSNFYHSKLKPTVESLSKEQQNKEKTGEQK